MKSAPFFSLIARHISLLQDFHPSTLYNFVFPPMTIDLPSNLYHDNDLMGLILYASFSFHGNPDIILNYLTSGISHFLYCQFQTITANVFDTIIACDANAEAITWIINLSEFIWISYIPGEPLKEMLQHSSDIKATFVSDWPDMMVQKCALRLLYQHDQVRFKQELRHCNDLILEQREIFRKHTEDYEKERNEQCGVDEKKIFSTSNYEVHLIPRFIDQSKTNETKTKLGKSDLLDFDQCRVYNSCFPLCEILEWFSHQSDEPPVTIPLPPNVFNDNTWMGLVLCASIAVEANPTAILDIQNSETTCNLICHLETNIESVEPLHVHHITEEDLKLLQQGGFIWLSYIPRGSFQESLNQCNQIEASVAIDFPGLVQKSGFHLLYKHDEVEFKETIRQCMALFSNEHEVVPKVIDQSETNETKTQLGKSDLLDFDQCRVYKSCFPLCEIPEWFSHQSNEAPVTIPLPPNVYNDSNWMGLALCAYVAIEANLDAFLGIQNSETSYNLICHLETSIECAEPLHVHHITKEDRKLLQQGGFIWLSYIPRGSFRDSLNQCSRIEASVVIDFPGLVQKCGFHLLYKHDEVEFKETIRQCMALFSNEHEVVPKVIDQLETNETKTQLGKSDLLDFDQCRVYKSCFPLREIPEWFSHQSNEAPVTIPLPPNVYNDSNWMGLALCAYVAIEANLDAFLDIQNSETSYNLICHLETSIECAEPLHVHHITKEDRKLLQQGGFIWLSYIPRGSFRDSLNQCSRIEASVVIDFPGLVQKCGFHLLYKHDEVEFRETIRQCVTFFSNEDEESTKISSSSKEDSQSEPVEPANCKDKGKSILEY
ncbi:hypothetical protein ACB092_11G181800 [Castanea dentata]